MLLAASRRTWVGKSAAPPQIEVKWISANVWVKSRCAKKTVCDPTNSVLCGYVCHKVTLKTKWRGTNRTRRFGELKQQGLVMFICIYLMLSSWGLYAPCYVVSLSVVSLSFRCCLVVVSLLSRCCLAFWRQMPSYYDSR